jgi:hypothetical protein
MSPHDAAFLPVGAFPNMQRHVSQLQSITMQAMTTNTFSTTSTTVPTFTGLAFALSGFGSGTGFSLSNALTTFDQYRIRLLEIWIYPLTGMLQNQSGSISGTGTFASAIDLDDASAPTTPGSVSSYASSIVSSGASGHYHRWQPHVAVALYSGVFSAFGNDPSPWIDSASSGVYHYGVKAAQSATSTVNTYEYTLRATVDFRSSF